MCSVSDFGKDLGLMHEVVVTGRKAGADREFWVKIAHDEGAFREAVKAVNGMDILLAVDYDRSIGDGVKAGNYDGSNSDITSDHFPSDKKGKTEVAARPIGFGRVIGSDEAIAELDKMGYRPADMQETLAYGEKFPKDQLKGPIVGLGSRWQDSCGLAGVPVLDRVGSGRGLRLFCFASVWYEGYRFLAVRKHQSR